MSTDFWTAQRNHPRVQAALTVKCQLCQAKPGDNCAWNGEPLPVGIVHMIRVPQDAMEESCISPGSR